MENSLSEKKSATDKELLLSKLLSTDTQSSISTRPLISEVSNGCDDLPTIPDENRKSATNAVSAGIPRAIEQEEPTMLELMMQAQQSAKQEKDALQKVSKNSKAFSGAGFKKGFLAGGTKSNKRTATTHAHGPTSAKEDIVRFPTSSSSNSSNQKSGRVDLRSIAGQSDSNSGGIVFDDVQKALEEDQHPLLKELSKNEWVNDDLIFQLQGNSLLSCGLRDPECMAAVQMMQENPQEAKKKFQNNEKVTRFLQEFGAVMAQHFEKLGTKETGPHEVGPLHEKALKKLKEQQPQSDRKIVEIESSISGQNKSTEPSRNAEEDKRVQQILEDEELRAMLMDPELQRILVECGDPVKFQMHMRNPDTARKIIRLQQSGLVSSVR